MMSRYLGKRKFAIKKQILSSISNLSYEGKIEFLEAAKELLEEINNDKIN